MEPTARTQVEADPRFPSGPWTGFFAQRVRPGRNTMSLDLHFRDGCLEGKGSDAVGPFTFSGSYDTSDGKCRWIKQYLGQHAVTYSGVNEGQGIWGVWEINVLWGLIRDRGVFHIWPRGMTPADADLTERAFQGDSGNGRVVAGTLGLAFLVGLYVVFRFVLAPMIERLFR
jgi:hypothetical protein